MYQKTLPHSIIVKRIKVGDHTGGQVFSNTKVFQYSNFKDVAILFKEVLVLKSENH